MLRKYRASPQLDTLCDQTPQGSLYAALGALVDVLPSSRITPAPYEKAQASEENMQACGSSEQQIKSEEMSCCMCVPVRVYACIYVHTC